MRLISATIESYRVHRHTTIDFAKALTLVVAPNESGKSTLVEAVHRGLFMPYRKGGQVLESMRSRDGGHPTVEIRFEAENRTWRLRKVFRGQQGTCTLTCESPAQQWANADAEDRLAELLVGNASVEGRIEERWDHLWATQGRSSQDPLRTTGSRELFAALDAGGGTEVLAIRPEDLALIEELRAEVEMTWGARGTVLTGSELGRLEFELTSADRDAAISIARRAERIGHVDQLRASRGTVARAEPEVLARRAKLQELESQLVVSRRDAQRLTTEREAAARASALLEEFDVATKRLGASRLEVEALAAQVIQQETAHRAAALEASEALSELARLVAATAASQGEQQVLSDRADLSEAISGERRLSAELQGLERQDAQRRKLEMQLNGERKALLEIPAVSSKDLKRLRKLDGELLEQRACLAGMAATVTWSSGKGPVKVGGLALKQGEAHIVDDVRELQVAGNLLVIGPGKGLDLASCRQQIAELEGKIKDGLATLGATTADHAAELLEARDKVEQKILSLETHLESIEDESERMATAKSDLTQARQRIQLLRSAGVEVPEDSSPSALRVQATAAKDAARVLMVSESKARKSLELRDVEARRAGQTLPELTGRLDRARGSLAADESRLGDEGVRARRRGELATAVAATLASVAEIEDSLLENSPELLERGLELSKKSLKTVEDELAGARQVVDLLTKQLGASLEQDLEADVEETQARVERLRRLVSAARIRAEGARLLLETLCSLRDEAREHREAPFLEAISRYLASMFVSARIGLEAEGEDRVLGLVDRGRAGLGSFRFEALSQGARELIGAAARLAMAEVIAAQREDSCLPVVFDDAFATVDPERLGQLGLVLDLARSRGLQVIVLSCNDRDCGNLGEDSLVRLQRPRHAGMGEASRPSSLVGDDVYDAEVEISPRRDQHLPLASEIPTSMSEDEQSMLRLVPAVGAEISTRILRTDLRWDVERFRRVRDLLLSRGAIVQPEGSRSLQRPS